LARSCLVEEVYDEITDPRGGKHVDAASERSDEIAKAIQGLRDWGATQPKSWGERLALARG
jgi:hypothetical protein